jgi:hypothetical protein
MFDFSNVFSGLTRFGSDPFWGSSEFHGNPQCGANQPLTELRYSCTMMQDE